MSSSRFLVAKCDFRPLAVLYPPLFRNVAMVVMFLGMPAYPLTVSLGLKLSGTVFASSTCTGNRPDWNEHLEGEHDLKP